MERGNRRRRKMQKSVCRARSQSCLEGRIALDMIRESRAEGRAQTMETLQQGAPRTYVTHNLCYSLRKRYISARVAQVDLAALVLDRA